MKVDASARTEGGQVAVNIRVWRPEEDEGVQAMILRMSGSKPLSSIRSASSRTR